MQGRKLLKCVDSAVIEQRNMLLLGEVFTATSWLSSVSKKTPYFRKSLAKNIKDKAFEVLKIKEFTFVNDCFQNENNAVFGVFLQRQIVII